jgi:hypothetical protein
MFGWTIDRFPMFLLPQVDIYQPVTTNASEIKPPLIYFNKGDSSSAKVTSTILDKKRSAIENMEISPTGECTKEISHYEEYKSLLDRFLDSDTSPPCKPWRSFKWSYWKTDELLIEQAFVKHNLTCLRFVAFKRWYDAHMVNFLSINLNELENTVDKRVRYLLSFRSDTAYGDDEYDDGDPYSMIFDPEAERFLSEIKEIWVPLLKKMAIDFDDLGKEDLFSRPYYTDLAEHRGPENYDRCELPTSKHYSLLKRACLGCIMLLNRVVLKHVKLPQLIEKGKMKAVEARETLFNFSCATVGVITGDPYRTERGLVDFLSDTQKQIGYSLIHSLFMEYFLVILNGRSNTITLNETTAAAMSICQALLTSISGLTAWLNVNDPKNVSNDCFERAKTRLITINYKLSPLVMYLLEQKTLKSIYSQEISETIGAWKTDIPQEWIPNITKIRMAKEVQNANERMLPDSERSTTTVITNKPQINAIEIITNAMTKENAAVKAVCNLSLNLMKAVAMTSLSRSMSKRLETEKEENNDVCFQEIFKREIILVLRDISKVLDQEGLLDELESVAKHLENVTDANIVAITSSVLEKLEAFTNEENEEEKFNEYEEK